MRFFSRWSHRRESMSLPALGLYPTRMQPRVFSAVLLFRRVARVDADALEAGHVKQQRIPAIERALFHGTKI